MKKNCIFYRRSRCRYVRNDTSNGSKIDNKGSQKVEREIKKQERLAQDAVEGQEEFNAAVPYRYLSSRQATWFQMSPHR